MRRLHVLRSGGCGKRAKLLLALVVPFSVASLVLAGPAAPAGASPGTIVPDGSPVTASVTTAGQTSVVTFTGTAGETLSLRAANWTFPADGGTTLQVEGSASQPIGPTGTLNGTGVVTLEPIVLPSAGQYSVVVDPSGLGDVGSVQLTLTDIGSVTPGGAAVTASVGTAGQVGVVSFQATAGELVGVQVDNSTFPSDSLTTMTITDTSGAPQSSVVYLNGGSSPFLGPVRLAQAGTYVIVVDPTNGTDVGSAQLTVSTFADTTGSITPNGPAVTAAVSVPGQRAVLTFSATAGQEFGIQASDSTFPSGATAPRFYIADSSGQEVGGDNYIYDPPVVDGPVTVPAAGTYQVVVDPGPDSAATGTVSVKLVSFTDQTGTLTPDGPTVTADITAPSQRAVYTFSGTASEKFVVSYTASTFTLDSDVLDVVDPTGKDVAQIPIDTPAGSTPAFTLPAAGTYQVIVDPTSQGDTGTISLSLLSVSDIQGTITPGSPVDVSITTPGQRAFYSFTTTTAGQQVSFTVAGSTFTSNKDELYVLDANGNGVGNTYFLADGTFGPITLGAPGTYQVVIDPAAYGQNDTGTLTLTLTPPAGQAAAIHSARIQQQVPAVLASYHARKLAGRALAASSPDAGVILSATLTETITTDGCTDSCAGTASHEVQTRTVTWTAKSDGTSAGTVQGTDTDTGMARGPVCTFPYYSDSSAVSSGTGTDDASISYLPDGANLDTYTIDLGAITGTTDTVANSIMAGHCVGIEPPTPARSTSTSATTNILASDHTVTGEIAKDADQVTGQQDCGSGTTVTNDIALIITTTSCTITWHAIRGASYVALGDSYSAGEGAPPFLAGTDGPSDFCHRSVNAYSQVLGRDFSITPQSHACSGAKTADITTQTPDGFGEPPQIKWVNPTPSLVTITIGGNDVGFVPVVSACIRQKLLVTRINDAIVGPVGVWLGLGLDPSCADSQPFVTSENKAIAEVSPKVEGAYQVLREKTSSTDTSIIAADYPHLFPSSPSEQGCLALSAFLTSQDMQYFNGAVDQLDGRLHNAAEEAGVNFVDVRSTFAGHEVCGNLGGWINGFSVASGTGKPCTWMVAGVCISANLPLVGSFHPNASGQSDGYAAKIEAYINAAANRTPEGFPLDPTPITTAVSPAAVNTAVAVKPSVAVNALNVQPVAQGAADCEGTYQAGQAVTVAGGGFTPGATVRLYVTSPGLGPTAEQQVGSATADPNGNVSVTIRIPRAATGFTPPTASAGLIFVDAIGTGVAGTHVDDVASAGLAPHTSSCGTVNP